MKRPLFLFALVATLLAMPVLAIAQTVNAIADFTYGNDDTTYVDAYPGIAGDNWIGPWVARATLATGTATVMTDGGFLFTPLAPDQGNYLDVAAEITATGGGGYAVGRDYAGRACIDPTVDSTVSFLFRVEETADSLASSFTGVEDRYQMYDEPTIRNGSTTTVRWLIGAYGAGDDVEVASTAAGNWLFYNGTNDSGPMLAANQVNTGIAIQSGHTLSVQVTNHVATRTWDATMTDLATSQSFTQTGMGWRVSPTDGSQLSGLVQFFGKGDFAGDGDTRHFALDAYHATGAAMPPPPPIVRVAAHFNGGGSSAVPVTNVVDAYHGMAGGGWAAGWAPSAKNAAGTATVLAPGDTGLGEIVSGAGNYLRVTADPTALGGGYSVGRKYNAEDGINPAVDHKVSFLFRVEESADELATEFTGTEDRYQIYDNSAKSNGSSGTCRWIIGAYGNGDGTTSSGLYEADKGHWLFYNGAYDSYMYPERQVNSGIAIRAGQRLNVEVTNHADTLTWDATITDLDTLETFTQTGMGWRVAGATTVAGYVQFCGRGDTASGDLADLRQFSIDEIVALQGSIPGDTNDDGKVDTTDAQVVALHWGQTGLSDGASVGDFNDDGVVNSADASILAANWNPGLAEEGGNVPEPASVVLLLGVVAALAIRRRSRRDS